MRQNLKDKNLLILGIIWLIGAISDLIWLAVDRTPPSWDLAKHLTGSLNYWHALQQSPQFFSGEWWTNFWMLSSKYPPLVYIATAPILNIFGTGPDQATAVNLLFSAILLFSVYGIGKHLFSDRVGLWAAGLCLLLPRLYTVRLEYLLDYPLTALVAASFCCLTLWRDAKTTKKSWATIFGFGLCFGLAMLVKQTALFFLFFPLLWETSKNVWRRSCGRLAQLASGLLLSIVIFAPWYRTNLIFVFSGFSNANIEPATLEGDPPLNTLAAWTYYWNDLPRALSWILLLVPIVCLLLHWKSFFAQSHINSALRWLAVFFCGSYFLASAIVNKDLRYIMPYLPIVSVFLAYGLTLGSSRLFDRIRWGSIGAAILLLFLNLYPVGGAVGSWLTSIVTPTAQHYAYTGADWPLTQVIDEIIKTEPYLRSNLGVLPSTTAVNQHNLNYYGALQNFQVYARQVGVRKKQVQQDARSLSWFVTKTGEQGSVPEEAQAAITQIVDRGGDFQPHKTWNLPDSTLLKLYRRRQPPVEVQLLTSPAPPAPPASPASPAPRSVKLERVVVPQTAPPGKPVPVTYEWSGDLEELRSGLVLLTWRNSSGSSSWLHDRGIGMGNLFADLPNPLPLAPSPVGEGWGEGRQGLGAKGQNSFQVIERLAMLPPLDVPAGSYTLDAIYLNRQTGEHYALPVTPVTLKIDPVANATPAPELDLITQMRALSAALPKGTKALSPVFEEVARINQYDPIQDYLVQASQALTFRLQQQPENLSWLYALALSQALQQQVDPLIATLKRITLVDAANPYAHAYLAFVYLYQWRSHAARTALQPAIALNPNLPEIQALSGIAALMQGNFFQAWQTLSALANDK
ncbi:MAG: phospholipid carrier-dependent glycosyltransferase [Cyanosarcina radialis HA8281-LM2]|jgi:4-amino-4-deoxy-L-arabinose transferase-like glycosyltransferase|nr:phospholipid carrier-dependent glycosyltransferase [Cyanosarcina radialis HA8281-LM2]